MSARVYAILDILDGQSDEVIWRLRGKPGILIADLVEGSPDVLMAVEAPDHEELAELTMQALSSVEDWPDNVQLLPVESATSCGMVAAMNWVDESIEMCK